MVVYEDDFFNVGDVVFYDIVDKFFVIVWVVEDEYKVYYNVCLYWGWKLCEFCGKLFIELCCLFYGWIWNFDGSLKVVLCVYDY